MSLSHCAVSTFDRRALLVGGLALAVAGPVAAAPSAPPGGRLAFDIYRKGRKIGDHTLEFTGDGDGLTMNARIQMVVAVGPVTVFRYLHQQTERWTGGRFDSLETRTLQNGERIRVVAQRVDGGVRMDGGKPAGTRTLAAGALPLTHWNRSSLSGPLFNPQDGRMMRLSVASQGPAPILLANGVRITATRIALAGEASIEDWYDAAAAWTGLKARAVDGSIVEYRRT